MVEINTILFLVVVALGAAVQTITGFAMGLIIMAGVALFALSDIAFAAAVVSFISLANTIVALRKGYYHVDWGYVRWILAGMLPAMIAGLWLLDYLSGQYYELLKLLLGLVIIIAGCLLMISPAPYANRSGRWVSTATGAAGGLLAGLYSASGAPLAYYMYRQPSEINTIRFTLLSVFAVSTFARSVMVGVSGQMTTDMLGISAVAIPLVIIVTLGMTKVVPHVPDRMVRVVVFVVLVIAGALLIAEGF